MEIYHLTPYLTYDSTRYIATVITLSHSSIHLCKMYNSKKSGAKLGLNIRILKLLIFSKLKTEITHTWGAARKVAPRTSSSPRGSPGFVPRRVPPSCQRTSPSAAAGCPGYCYSSCFYARQIFTMFYTTF